VTLRLIISFVSDLVRSLSPLISVFLAVEVSVVALSALYAALIFRCRCGSGN
jgi:hypothetical protein